jgi:pantoate--beta-alanine ligase
VTDQAELRAEVAALRTRYVVEREPDGLARSPENAALTAEERRAASGLFRALLAGHLLHELGERSPAKILKAVRTALTTEPLIRIETLALLDEKTLQSVEKKMKGRVILAAAVKIGSTRLVDSVRFG